MKRITIALLLAMALLVTSVACQQTPPTATPEPTAGTTPTPTEEVVDPALTEPFYKSPTEITLTQGRDSNKGGAGEDWDLDDNMLTDAIYDITNIRIVNDWELTGEEYTQKVQLIISTNDLPDVLFIDSISLLKEMVEKDLLEDLTATQQVFSDRLKDIYGSYADNRNLQSVTFGGKLYALPSTNIGGQHETLWVRRDWVENLGMEMPTTLDEVLDMAQAFVEQDPDGNNADDTIGLPLLSTKIGVNNDLYSVDPILACFGAYPRTFMKDGEGNTVYGSITDEMKAGITKIAELVQGGIITVDPDMGDVLTLNQCGMFFGPWWSVWSHLWGARTANRYQDWVPVSAPLNDEGKLVTPYQKPNVNFLVVRKGYEHPAAAVRVLNVTYGLYNGDTGETALAPHAQVGLDMPQNFMAWPFPLQMEREDYLYQMHLRLQAALDADSDEPLQPNEKRVFANMKTYFENPQCDTTDWAETVAKLLGTGAAYEDFQGFAPVIYDLDPSMMETYEPLLELEQEMLPQIIRGEATLDAFDQFVAQWKSMGGDSLIEAINASME